jgi:chemotaxis protein CheD
MNNLAVGLGEIKVSRNPQDVLVAFGLGSCVGIGLFDPVVRVGGMLHAVLPKNNNNNDANSAKFVDTGLRLLLDQVINAGGLKSRLVVRMAGGANILTAPGANSTFDIGTRNAETANIALNELGLKLSKVDIGGHTGRTVRLYILDGRMTVRMMGSQEKEM